jgi:hypothetical protein
MLVSMARQESEREDLLREATALVERMELAPPDEAGADHVVVGFRSDGAMSVFFGTEPVYQFNTAGQLRRAFCEGLLYKAVCGRLASLHRVRQRGEVQLQRHELTEDEQAVFISEMHYRLRELLSQLNAERLTIVGQVPADADVWGRVKEWLATHESVAIATTPSVGGASSEQCD